ncbi:phosphate uptake regulator PhoU [Vulcanisaeta distributa]|uniref:Phosphate uptake regulator, PhoU n=1 Tax=Vulcanisaeta distributa (strain DSM 14429 / JCM 11212 / NBRC 100878 / IC-017) TaxID=572478 RepID=E1QT60_VULDI|nr:phosphate uptake regulator PhoU [Vulcanisaeta distributa]ADN49652.1 phosphate uptake regulator, PhoU [Vulcanisaeta distributa DSM 14429]
MVEEEVRKVVASGRSSIAITIPKKWVSALGIEAGSYVLLRFMGDHVAIIPLSRSVRGSSVSNVIEVDRDSSDYVLRRLITQYLRGVDEIKVKFDGFTGIKDEVKELVRERISGAEVIEEGNDYIVFRFVTPIPEVPIKRLLNRMALTVLGMLKDSLDMLRGSAIEPSDIIDRDNEVDRLYLLIERLVMMGITDQSVLSKLEAGSSKELVNSLMVSKSIERAGDHAWRIAQIIGEASHMCCKLSELLIVDNIIDLGLNSADILREAAMAFINGDVNDAMEVLDRRVVMRSKSLEVIKSIYGSSLHVDVGGRLMMIVESIRRISEYSYDIAEITLDTYG